MKKIAYIAVFFMGTFAGLSQKKVPKQQQRDSISPEVIRVVTSYMPKIADAFKIKQNPKLILNKNIERKTLDYSIFSAPVASTFIPKSGKMRSMKVGKKERIYPNYLALGFGNDMTPFGELFFEKTRKFDFSNGIHLKYISSNGNIKTSPLESKYSDIYGSVFFRRQDRNYDYKVVASYERKERNWYGLPQHINFIKPVISKIESKQSFSFFELSGDLKFGENNYLDQGRIAGYYFKGSFGGNEMGFNVQPKFIIPIESSLGESNLILEASIDYLGGRFEKNYGGTTEINHKFFTAGVHPTYQTVFNGLDIRAGAKMYFSSDIVKGDNKFFIYPNVNISYPIAKEYANVYIGAEGDLHNNSYKKMVDLNPFVSPNLFLNQTNEKYGAFLGFFGKFTHGINFDLRGTYKDVENKPLFIRNNSISNGKQFVVNSASLMGYEFGNSFNLVYENVKAIEVFLEVTADMSRDLDIGLNATYNSFKHKNQLEVWNVPAISGQVFADYKRHKWYAGINTFYVGERKAVIYKGTYPSAIKEAISLQPYIDINLKGGYHFHHRVSAFLKVNNVLNKNYERFANYNVRGLQVLGGFNWKFDL